eukprot:comp21575_c0_seq1/m.30146 comp21575_c0_seq1/g.30146  ORF comp21575_c0_seq1/g.30146 comp21575_c0_seq1/m.30146 type:complete len:778 (-) comp21575_c0_seq1:11-2344(-)
MDFLWSSLSAAARQPEHSGADTVDKLCDRVARSTLLEDRRDAVRALKALAREYQLEVGTQGMDILMQVLQNDRSDVEIVRYALEAMALIFHTRHAAEGGVPDESDIGVGFTEIFVKHTDYVTLLLSLVEEHDFYVRFHAVQVLNMLLANRPMRLQECVLADPRGVSRLVDLLDDQREMIRNEALLLLIQLTKANPAIQKLVVFENAFDRLLGIIVGEGLSDGGLIVQDCLHILHNLLRKNISNQNYFRETSCMKRLAPFLSVAPPRPHTPPLDEEQEDTQVDPATGWPVQKTTNMLMMVELVRILLVPGSASTATNQMALNRQGAVSALLKMTLQNSQLPSRVRVPVRFAAAEAISGNSENQALFMAMTDSDGSKPRPVVVALVADLLAFRNPFDFRCASLYCLECLLHRNAEAQQFMVSTLSQPLNANLDQAQDTPLAVGAQLLSAVTDTSDGVSHWAACLALAHMVRSNNTAKAMLMATQVQTEAGSVPLLSKLVDAFTCDGMQQARVWCGQFVLLSTLCMDCPTAISTLLSMPQLQPFLIQQIQQQHQGTHVLTQGLAALLLGICMQWNDNRNPPTNRAALLHVIHHVVKTDRYSEALASLIKQDPFARAQQHHQLVASNPDEAWLDFPFTVLAKKAKDDITATITQSLQAAASPLMAQPKGAAVDHTAVLQQYQSIVQGQDEQLKKLRQQHGELAAKMVPGIDPAAQAEADRLVVENAALKEELSGLQGRLSRLQSEQDDLLVLLAEQETARKILKGRLRALGQEVSEDEDEE